MRQLLIKNKDGYLCC